MHTGMQSRMVKRSFHERLRVINTDRKQYPIGRGADECGMLATEIWPDQMHQATDPKSRHQFQYRQGIKEQQCF